MSAAQSGSRGLLWRWLPSGNECTDSERDGSPTYCYRCALAAGGCAIQHVESTARENAIRRVVGLHERSVECFNEYLADYRDDEDFFAYVSRLAGEGCGSPLILNKTDDEIAGMNFKPTGSNTWYTSGTRTGDRAVLAVTTVGDGRATATHASASQSLAVCWTLVVDVPGRTAQAVNDDGECHDAVLFGDTKIVTWDEVAREYEELDN
ncbi:hypothetical protein [Georgenia ruanii]|uniref:hypothetical protein n=1 Tax=Georgenia ruanii TaxID=348442 RepID=UPI0012655731|nr:hypothetical protein [Georgenia ruanii]